MLLSTCEFETKRLLAKTWHSLSSMDWRRQPLEIVVSAMLTESVTRSLPGPWRGDYTTERAREWIAERDREGTTLLVIEKSNREAAGLIILVEFRSEKGFGTDIRLGYLLAESSWGTGIATEAVGGFIGWCRARADVRSVSSGVDRKNVASMRVLEKTGFRRVPEEDETDDRELTYLLDLS